ncbi:hypothetical protein [Bombilactobacillus bombi]|uniref:hypothetical protein n=1 Tax=Bombilactobacillus bombi TaxID=1303590 RepID=UPI0015E5DEAE|nr:hypothetical protein [Bombilactobacillus bombi]MBA1434057.1 hypothetical protein [Bombilactobacillus bombi]
MTLNDLKNMLHVSSTKTIEVKYQHQQETKRFIKNYFQKRQIKANCVGMAVIREHNRPVYVNTFELKLPNSLTCTRIIEDISLNRNIMRIRRIHA